MQEEEINCKNKLKNINVVIECNACDVNLQNCNGSQRYIVSYFFYTGQ